MARQSGLVACLPYFDQVFLLYITDDDGRSYRSTRLVISLTGL